MDTQQGLPQLLQVVLDCTDARALAEFYRELLGFQYRPGHEPPAAGEPDPAGSALSNNRQQLFPRESKSKPETISTRHWGKNGSSREPEVASQRSAIFPRLASA